jgi:hypothetical protein
MDCQFGKDIVTNGGFKAEAVNPRLVLPFQSVYNNQIIYSNSGMYWKLPNGTLIPETQPELFHTHRYPVVFLFIFINALLLWLLIRAGSKHNK